MTATKVQKGFTNDKDSFVINFNQTGMWFVNCYYDVIGDGEWTATYDSSSNMFKTGDTVPFNTPDTPLSSQSGSGSSRG